MGRLEHQVADVIIDIEREMRLLGLWEPMSPPLSALGSPHPFCIDTLEFTQWLQWVFIPKVKTRLEADDPLPAYSDIRALAEMVLEDYPEDTDRLVALIHRFDRLVTEAPARP